MNLDIQTSVQTAFLLCVFLGSISLILGLGSIRAGSKLQYFRKRHDRVMHGWRMIFVAFIFGIAALLVNSYAEPTAYKFFPPSPTITLTSTATLTPTISLTPTLTLTPTITETPSITNTPALPEDVIRKFESTTTPAAVPVFSPVQFARKIDKNYQPIDPVVEFANPITEIYGTFSYDQMTPNAQWSALWYRDGKLVYYETIPWNGGTGGYGYTQWAPASEEWLPGTYEVQIFVGNQWVKGASGTFMVTGSPPTSTAAPPPTRTPIPTSTIGPTTTPSPSVTPTVTRTPTSTLTPTITKTPTITNTPRPTDTRWPTLTPNPNPQ